MDIAKRTTTIESVVKNNTLSIVATDLDIIFHDEISDIKIDKEGSTTTSATVLYDLLRKLPSNLDVTFDLENQNKRTYICSYLSINEYRYKYT